MREVHGSLRTTYGRTYVGCKIMRTDYFWLTMEKIVASLFRDAQSVRYTGTSFTVPSELHALTSHGHF
ncbi:hypothetical protein CK203_025415 [Vitis vinifera]|uniref:Uncharacterized protein n=1 Tax=Vitis vinifera TaxID=29760 RepID=A0A438IZT3_VITVI|nr:hypothetical protein CK203_025415 [Vitis vinifera]